MWTAIALIAIVSIAASAWRKKDSLADSKRVQELNDRVDSLERDLGARVETLERIVTDSKEDLKRQFDHLDKTA
jgi:outer membrane murein-binding lipoprotein Lpp